MPALIGNGTGSGAAGSGPQPLWQNLTAPSPLDPDVQLQMIDQDGDGITDLILISDGGSTGYAAFDTSGVFLRDVSVGSNDAIWDPSLITVTVTQDASGDVTAVDLTDDVGLNVTFTASSGGSGGMVGAGSTVGGAGAPGGSTGGPGPGAGDTTSGGSTVGSAGASGGVAGGGSTSGTQSITQHVFDPNLPKLSALTGQAFLDAIKTVLDPSPGNPIFFRLNVGSGYVDIIKDKVVHEQADLLHTAKWDPTGLAVECIGDNTYVFNDAGEAVLVRANVTGTNSGADDGSVVPLPAMSNVQQQVPKHIGDIWTDKTSMDQAFDDSTTSAPAWANEISSNLTRIDSNNDGHWDQLKISDGVQGYVTIDAQHRIVDMYQMNGDWNPLGANIRFDGVDGSGNFKEVTFTDHAGRMLNIFEPNSAPIAFTTASPQVFDLNGDGKFDVLKISDGGSGFAFYNAAGELVRYQGSDNATWDTLHVSRDAITFTLARDTSSLYSATLTTTPTLDQWKGAITFLDSNGDGKYDAVRVSDGGSGHITFDGAKHIVEAKVSTDAVWDPTKINFSYFNEKLGTFNAIDLVTGSTTTRLVADHLDATTHQATVKNVDPAWWLNPTLYTFGTDNVTLKSPGGVSYVLRSSDLQSPDNPMKTYSGKVDDKFSGSDDIWAKLIVSDGVGGTLPIMGYPNRAITSDVTIASLIGHLHHKDSGALLIDDGGTGGVVFRSDGSVAFDGLSQTAKFDPGTLKVTATPVKVGADGRMSLESVLAIEGAVTVGLGNALLVATVATAGTGVGAIICGTALAATLLAGNLGVLLTAFLYSDAGTDPIYNYTITDSTGMVGLYDTQGHSLKIDASAHYSLGGLA